MLFGSLIAPTDTIAVIGILKKAGVPKSLETKITFSKYIAASRAFL
ncbi:MAG: hypothetical protein AABY49_10550 [Planctomycetota bacterium]